MSSRWLAPRLFSAPTLDPAPGALLQRSTHGRRTKPLTAASLAALRAEHTQSIDPARALAAETQQLERSLSDLINTAYGLTPAEVALMWDTAPPRMPTIS